MTLTHSGCWLCWSWAIGVAVVGGQLEYLSDNMLHVSDFGFAIAN